jgi:thiamine biosynthesis lipoprotein
VDRLEAQMTVYCDDSELAALNRAAFHRPVADEPRLFELFERAQRLSRETGGAFDITASPLVRCWGFFHRKGCVPSEAELAEARSRVGFEHLELDEANWTVRFRRPGMEINLGSIGKGYAVDRAAAVLKNCGLDNFLLHGGQSSVLACGNRSGEVGWGVGIRNPLFPRRRLAMVRLRDGALGTSGSGEQFFRSQGRRYGHILDPRTGRPAEGILSVTVTAPTAAEADALATAFFVLGVEKTREYCDNHPGIGAILIPHPKRGTRLEILRLGSFAEGPSDGVQARIELHADATDQQPVASVETSRD